MRLKVQRGDGKFAVRGSPIFFTFCRSIPCGQASSNLQACATRMCWQQEGFCASQARVRFAFAEVLTTSWLHAPESLCGMCPKATPGRDDDGPTQRPVIWKVHHVFVPQDVHCISDACLWLDCVAYRDGWLRNHFGPYIEWQLSCHLQRLRLEAEVIYPGLWVPQITKSKSFI